MGYIIALAGKGGTGKTTIAGLLVRLIVEKKMGPVLAVDADPNSNLAEVLGLKSQHTIGQILDEVAANPDKIPHGMAKDRFIEYQVQTTISEGEGVDLLTMGKPEGPGCYCYVNNVLRGVVERLIKDYKFVIIDNEAGLEHLSRRTTRHADAMLVISEVKPIALRAAKRISELVGELKIKTGKKLLIINSHNKNMEKEKIKDLNLEYLGFIPEDKEIIELSSKGESLWKLKKDSAAYLALEKLLAKII
jgi:CO dehydrogenase maturation factor